MPGGIGRGAYGGGPWGGAEQEVLGQNSSTQFDLFCFEHCEPMLDILIDPIITTVDAGSQLVLNYPDPLPPPSTTCDLGVLSGDSSDPGFSTANVIIQAVPTSGVPNRWTTQWIFELESIPPDFGDLVNNHIYLGSSDAAGPVAGIFISAMGIAYTGSVHHVAGNLVLDAPLQVIPGTASLIKLGEPIVCRIACDGDTGVTYIFFTTVSQALLTGQSLIAVLPAIDASDVAFPPIDRSMISSRGSTIRPSRTAFDAWCMASTVLIANLPPVADAGVDQAIRLCSIARLDGTRSFDPEGVPLLYSWRMINGPTESSFVESATDGRTIPLAVPTGFTSKFHTAAMQAVHTADAFQVGDVLLVNEEVYDIVSTGTDGDGFFLLISTETIPDNISGAFFKVLRQRGLSGPTTSKPTFFADVLGFFQFDLVVSDGALESQPSVVVLNVVNTALPRGIVPDLEFVFDYLSDYWDLVEDREVVATFWSAMVQIASAELLTLWQHDYSKSLRDIQRTFLRRWIHYDLLLAEPQPELTVLRTVFGGMSTSDIAAGGAAGIASTSFTLSSGVHASATINVAGADPVTATQLAELLRVRLLEQDTRYTTQVVTRRATGVQFVRINAPFPFTVSGSSLPVLANGSSGVASGSGVAVGTRSYRLDTSAFGLGLVEDDLLILGTEAYRISEIADDPSDDIAFQRVILKETIPSTGVASWSISGHVSSRFLDFYNGLVSGGDACFFEVIDLQADESSSVQLVQCQVLGAPAGDISLLGFDPSPLAGAHAVASRYVVRLAKIVRRTYLPISKLIVDVPTLQELIQPLTDEAVLRRNIDFFIEEYRGASCLKFASGIESADDVWEEQVPPDRLWAEYTYIDNRETIEANFGVLAGITADEVEALPGDVDYLSAVRGLIYAYVNGPTVSNLRIGAQITLGLPFAEKAGTILEIRDDFSPSNGRILIQDADAAAIVRSYSYPRALGLEVNPATGAVYVEGDTVVQFAPLVEGAEVVDYVSDPDWFLGMQNQGIFTELQKFHTFVVRVDSSIFDLGALIFTQQFMLTIKPVYTYPLFLIVLNTGTDTTVSVTDSIVLNVALLLNDAPCASLLSSGALDDARLAGGGLWNKLDSDPDLVAPTYPTSDSPVVWGLDYHSLCPSDSITATCCDDIPGPGIPLDSCFLLDTPIIAMARFTDVGSFAVPNGSTGLSITLQTGGTVPLDGTITAVRIAIAGGPGADPDDYELVIAINAVDQITEAFTSEEFYTDFSAVVSEAVTAGDVITARVRHGGGSTRNPDWTMIRVDVTTTTPDEWTLDQVIPAGTYCARVTLL